MILKLGVPLATAAMLTLWAGSACAGEAPRPKPRSMAHAGPAMRLQMAQFMLPPNRAFKPIGGDRPYFAWLSPLRSATARS